ncbi:MAG: DUF6069 family protein [Acidimicrobiia bacterium]
MDLGSAYRVLVRPIMWSTFSAMVASLLVTTVAGWLGVSMLVEVEGELQELNPWSVAFTAGFVVLFGGLIAIGMLTFLPRAGLVFGVTAMIVFAISLFMPLTLTADGGTLVTMLFVHVVVLAPTLILIVPTMIAPPDRDALPT